MAKIQETAQKEEMIPVSANVLKELQDRLQKLESANKNSHEEWKKKYDWPRLYTYKTWLGKPVINYASKKKDPTRELVYTWPNGNTISNHFLDITTVIDDSWKTEIIEVEVNAFNNGCGKSEPMNALKTENGFEFATQNFGTFTVRPDFIN